MDGIVGEDELPFASIDYAGGKQGMYIPMNGFYIAPGPACRLANTHRPSTGHRLEQFPALHCQYLPKQVDGGKGDVVCPALATKCGGHLTLRILNGGNAQRQRDVFFSIHSSTSIPESVLQKLHANKIVRQLVGSKMLVITLACLVVVAKYTNTILDQRETVFDIMLARSRRLRYTPDLDVDEATFGEDQASLEQWNCICLLYTSDAADE